MIDRSAIPRLNERERELFDKAGALESEVSAILELLGAYFLADKEDDLSDDTLLEVASLASRLHTESVVTRDLLMHAQGTREDGAD